METFITHNMVTIDTKQTTSLATTICSYIFGDTIATVVTYQEQITFLMQNGAFLVSMIAGVVTVYYTIKKYRNGKN